MEDFKHILLSILPFGYDEKEKSYKFSLCIDLNPNVIESKDSDETKKVKENEDLIYSLRYFITNYSEIFIKIKNQLIDDYKIKIEENNFKLDDVEKPVNICFPTFIDHVNEIWGQMPPKVNENLNNDYPIKFSPSLNIDDTIAIFKNDTIPNLDEIRGFAIENAERSIKSGFNKEMDYESYVAKYLEFEEDIIDFSQKIEGISSFSEELNSIQSKLLNTNSFPIASVLDTIDGILEFWSFLDSNSILQRLVGKTIDFKIEEKYLFQFLNDNSIQDNFEIRFDPVLNDDLKNSGLKFESLKTPLKLFREQHLIIVPEDPSLKILENLEAKNYDIGGKLIALKSLQDKFPDYINQLKDPFTKESEKINIHKKLIALDTAALTTGVSIYNSNLDEIIKESKKLSKSNTDLYYLNRIIAGYRFVVESDSHKGKFLPLGQRGVILKKRGKVIDELPECFKVEEFAISDSGMHALLDENGKLMPKVIVDNIILNWNGENIGMPSPFSNQENEENFDSTQDEGSTSPVTKFIMELMSNFFAEEYNVIGVKYPRLSKIENEDHFELNTDTKNIPVLLEYQSINNTNEKLIFGREYKFIKTPVYKNSFSVSNDQIDVVKSQNSQVSFVFKRNEPVKPVEFYLHEPIIEEYEETINETGDRIVKQRPVEKREGESLTNLVIRNYSKKDNDKVYKTKQKSIRHILPPAISFQHSLWHNKIFKDSMSITESYKWYKKHHFPTEYGELLRGADGKVIIPKQKYNKENITIDEVIEGTTRMREYYKDGCQINYLPDPLSKGFRFEFFRDKNRLIKDENYQKYEQLEFYFSGEYPQINAWKIIVEDFNNNDKELVTVNYNKEDIIIRAEKGNEVFISVRTILHENYELQFETFGNYNDFTRYGNNDLLTPSLDFSIVHATQRPLVRPKLNNILKNDKRIDKTTLAITAAVNIEQTNTYNDNAGIVRYIENTLPTGNIELYAKWEEYQDNPKHITADDWTPNEPINIVDLKTFRYDVKNGESPAIFQTNIDIAKQLEPMESTLNKIANNRNDFKNYAVDLNFSYDIKETKFIEKYFWIKNKSKFASYYPKHWGVIDEDTTNSNELDELDKNYRKSKEIFNRLSSEPFLVKILNNKKPNPPIIADKNITLVSVIEDRNSKNTIHRKASMNRLRLFFERGRLTSGKGERIGFVVNEPQSKNNDFLVDSNLVSIVGRDIVSDSIKPYDGLFRNNDVLLTKANFVINDPYDLKDFDTNKKVNDLESFYPEYVKDLGIMTYLPKFDKKLNLWYLDVELDINNENGKELHSPFIQFALVHYQENSIDYKLDIANDCRISNIYKSGYIYIMGSRTLTIKPDFDKEFSIIINTDESTVVDLPLLKTKFYCIYEEKERKDIWMHKSNEKEPIVLFQNLKINEKNILKIKRDHSKPDCRLTIIETEYRVVDLNIDPKSLDDLLENKNYRIVQTNTFEL